MNLKRAHPQFNLGNLESLAGAKEKMRVATTLPAVFTRVSSLFLLECHPIISNSKAEGKVPHSHNSHWLTLISSC